MKVRKVLQAVSALLTITGTGWAVATPASAAAQPRIAIGDTRVVEGQASYRVAVFGVTLSEPTDRRVTVAYRTTDGSARSGRDYQARSGRLTIPAHSRSATVAVAVRGDRRRETDETFTLSLASPTDATLARARAAGTILDDDTRPSATTGRPAVSIGDASIVEGDRDAAWARVPVTLSARTDHTVAVRYRTATASAGRRDFVSASGVVSIPAGSTSTTIAVNVLGDLDVEAREVFRVELTYASWSSRTRRTGYVAIVDDDRAAARPTRSLWSFGSNASHELGDGTTINRTSPVPVGGTAGWSVVSAGYYHSCGIRSGALWCWGYNYYGQLGDGTSTGRPFPVQIGSANDWTDVSTGQAHTCGIRSGTMWCWGDNFVGQLGDGTNTGRSRPVQIGSANDWVDLSAGNYHNCGIRAGGNLWCWGYNSYGQLGDGTRVDRAVPTLLNASGPWAQVSGGTYYTCGIRSATLWCWGSNDRGQLGDGDTQDRSRPVQVDRLGPWNWSAVSAGSHHTCGLRASRVWCFGLNDFGQLGIVGVPEQHVPVPVVGTGFGAVSVGENHTCAIADGSLWCWGRNDYGQLGDGTTAHSAFPVRAGSAADWTMIDAGEDHLVGIRR